MYMLYFLFLFSKAFSVSESIENDVYDEMLEIVKLCYTSSCKAKYIEAWDCYWCDRLERDYSDVYLINDTKMGIFFYSVVQDETTLVVGYRGSVGWTENWVEDSLNWIMNVQFWFSALPFAPKGVKVHHGFLKSYQESKELLFSRVESVVDNFPSVKKLLFVGHSLGSSLTVLGALDIIQTCQNKRVREIVSNGDVYLSTIGEPRLGNEKFYDWYLSLLGEDKMMRLVNQRDPVPSVPPRFLGYHHVPTEYWFQNSTKEFHKCNGSGEDPSCSDSIKEMHHNSTDHETYLGLFVESATEKCL